MRELADADRIRRFMHELGRSSDADARVYFTGGATAVLCGWRASTIDVDMKVVPDTDSVLRALPRIKEALRVNVEIASPSDFIPVPAGWEERSPFVAREGRINFHHFDPYAQALAKVERGHAQDLEDVRAMIANGMVDPARALQYFGSIEPELYRFPALDPGTFRRAVEEAFSRP